MRLAKQRTGGPRIWLTLLFVVCFQPARGQSSDQKSAESNPSTTAEAESIPVWVKNLPSATAELPPIFRSNESVALVRGKTRQVFVVEETAGAWALLRKGVGNTSTFSPGWYYLPAFPLKGSWVAAQPEEETPGSSGDTTSSDGVRVEGGSLVIELNETGKTFRFALGTDRGLLGPSSDPSSQKPFVNKARSVFAVTAQPETKTGFVHIYYKTPQGDIVEIPDVNQKIKDLYATSGKRIAENFLRVEAVHGERSRFNQITSSIPHAKTTTNISFFRFASLRMGASRAPERFSI